MKRGGPGGASGRGRAGAAAAAAEAAAVAAAAAAVEAAEAEAAAAEAATERAGAARGGGPTAIRRGQSGVAFAASAQARGLCVVTTILPFVIYSAIPIGAVVIWLVARSVMRSEIRASNQLVERRREEWRAGGCVGPEPGKYRGPERSDWRGWFAGGGPGMGGGGGGGCGGGGN